MPLRRGADVLDVIRLNDGGISARVPAPTGLRVECVGGGSVWVTQAGGTGDVIVRAGESFVTTLRGKVVVQAMGAASFTFEDQA